MPEQCLICENPLTLDACRYEREYDVVLLCHRCMTYQRHLESLLAQEQANEVNLPRRCMDGVEEDLPAGPAGKADEPLGY